MSQQPESSPESSPESRPSFYDGPLRLPPITDPKVIAEVEAIFTAELPPLPR